NFLERFSVFLFVALEHIEKSGHGEAPLTKGRFMTVFMSAPRSIKWDELRTLKQVGDLDQLQKENSRQVLSLWTALTVRGRMSTNY
ncbi:MAG TPA: hypothetical protein PLL95_14510, partial [Anaerolineales bacterium]|nr:hypothetical protein [Anaerolineales bacterium]